MASVRLAVAFLLVVVPMLVLGQQRPWTIGVVYYRTPITELTGSAPASPTARALVRGLAEKGWVDGRNIRLVWKTGVEHAGGTKGAVEDLVRLRADVIVVGGNDIAVDAARLDPSIPVVMASSDFPVENGIVASYSRPGKTSPVSRIGLVDRSTPSALRY